MLAKHDVHGDTILRNRQSSIHDYIVIMNELYKVRKIKLSLLDQVSHKSYKEIQCEFGRLIEDEGILLLETHIFNEKKFTYLFYNCSGFPASATMSSFDNVEIEAPFMVFTRMSTKENKVTLRCLHPITVFEEDEFYTYQKRIGEEMLYSQLLRIDFWGLDLVIPSWPVIPLMVYDAPFDIQLDKDDETNNMFATFPINQKVAHNNLTEEIFLLFRDSLVGYLSLINGARVQITKECYNGFIKLFSYNKIENTSHSCYACENARFFNPAPILFEFDNYIRWNQLLDFNKFISHISSAQQELHYENGAFILILVFEGLCKKYLDIHKSKKISKTIIPHDSFENIKRKFNEIVKEHDELSSKDISKFKEAINRLNDVGLATFKFRLILDELNIKRTKEIENLIRKVRSTLVHEAELKEYSDYVLLSELIREIILRLISSTVKRHSEFENQVIKGEAPNLSYIEYIEKNDLIVDDSGFFSKFDKRVPFRITNGKNLYSKNDNRLSSHHSINTQIK